MKASICGICLNSGMLCMACNRKLVEGKITDGDVKVARAVHELSKTLRPLESVTIIRVIDGKNVMVIVCGKGDRSKMIGRDGTIISKLSRALGKAVRVVEETGDAREFVQDLIRPVPLEGMNIVYNQEGETFKIIIPKGRDIPIPVSSLDEIIRMVFGRGSVVVRE